MNLCLIIVCSTKSCTQNVKNITHRKFQTIACKNNMYKKYGIIKKYQKTKSNKTTLAQQKIIFVQRWENPLINASEANRPIGGAALSTWSIISLCWTLLFFEPNPLSPFNCKTGKLVFTSRWAVIIEKTYRGHNLSPSKIQSWLVIAKVTRENCGS